MPKYGPIITREGWLWHVRLEEAVRKGVMKKVPDDFTVSGWCYIPILSQPGKSRLSEKEIANAESNEKQRCDPVS